MQATTPEETGGRHVAVREEQVGSVLHHVRDCKQLDKDDYLQFLAFAGPHAPHTLSQLFQDLWALWVNDQKVGGYFVEFGAGDGVKLSNSYFLERHFRWRGIVAEPHPVLFKKAARMRRCHVSNRCVFDQTGQSLTFNLANKGELSRLAIVNPQDGHEAKRNEGFTEIAVETISLNDLLAEYEAPRVIDYISVDTEGSELRILEAFDFDRWDVRAFTVEHNNTEAEGRLDALFAARGYRRMWSRISRFDAWYVKD
jgi:FkbM family methyltransferase